jgi:hypothetical protein
LATFGCDASPEVIGIVLSAVVGVVDCGVAGVVFWLLFGKLTVNTTTITIANKANMIHIKVLLPMFFHLLFD